jgi:hypothetical protein
MKEDENIEQEKPAGSIEEPGNTKESENTAVNPHHKSGQSKKFKDYLSEFLMLFLAVTAGFFAENTRDAYTEHNRAIEFSGSLLSDLKEDTAALAAAIAFSNNKIKAVDKFYSLVEQPREKWNDTLVYLYASTAVRVKPYERSSDTYEQMKASGSLRYLKEKLTNLLDDYDVQGKRVETRESIDLKYYGEILIPFMVRIIDKRPLYQLQDGKALTYPLVFRKSDKETVALWINYMAIVKATRTRTLAEYIRMQEMAKKIIVTIENEYPRH